jgi:hypothetical protein
VDDGGGTNSMTMTSANAITGYQDAFVQKAIDTLNDLPSVLWEISEEAPDNSTWWQAHMIALIHSYESGKSAQHPVGFPSLDVMPGSSDATLYNSDADWVAPQAKLSPTKSCGSGTPACKVNGVCSAPNTRYDNLRDNMGYVLRYANTKLDLERMTPQSTLSSTTWCLANAVSSGAEYLVYAPSGGSFTVNLSATTQTLNVEWFDPATDSTMSAGTVSGGSSSQSFKPPFNNDAVLYLVDSAGHA